MSQVGRNDPCPCGSGRKYKKCCLPKDRKERLERREESDEEQAPEIFSLPDTDEDIDHMPEPGFSPPESPYPQVDLSLLDLPPAKEEIVEAWWDEFMPAFRREDVDEMIRRIEAFMEEHPDLFVHLVLEEGGLFELGSMLGKRGEQSRYAELLMRIRREHPDMYVRAFGYYEIPVITEVLMRGERERIPEYFNFFQEYPDSHPGELKSVVDILLATNCQEQLFDLARSTAVPCIQSPEVMSGDFIFRWYLFESWVPFLERGDVSQEAVAELTDKLEERCLHCDNIELDEEKVRSRMASTFKTPTIDEQVALKNQEDYKKFCREMCNNFMLFLYERRGMTWATACFFADALESYLNTNAEFFRPGAPLNFQQDKLDKHLSSCRSLLGLDGIMAMAGLQAVYEFIPYLKENELRFTPGPDDMIKISQNLHELCLKVMAGDDPAKRVFAAFPTYCWID